MTRRLQALERRLARIAAVVNGWIDEARRERQLQNARKVIASLIRDGLERAGLDPQEAVTLRRYEAIKPSPPPPPPWRRVDPREAFVAEMQALAERMRGHPPNLASASPAMLLAYYCFGEGAKEAPG